MRNKYVAPPDLRVKANNDNSPKYYYEVVPEKEFPTAKGGGAHKDSEYEEFYQLIQLLDIDGDGIRIHFSHKRDATRHQSAAGMVSKRVGKKEGWSFTTRIRPMKQETNVYLFIKKIPLKNDDNTK